MTDLFRVAVNLPEPEDLDAVMCKLSAARTESLTRGERTGFAAGLFQELAERRRLMPKLRRRPGKKQ